MRTRLLLAVLVALLGLTPAVAPADSPLVIRVPPALVVEHPKNVATGTIQLKNAAKVPTPVFLSADDFVAKSTGAPLGTTAVFFLPGSTSRAPVYDATLAPGASVAVNVEVTNVWEAGESTARLLNHGQPLDTLRAVKYRVPLAVRVLGSAETPPVIDFESGVPREVLLKNDDGMTYTIDWRLVVGGYVATGDAVTLPPQGTGTIKVIPRPEWISSPLEAFFKGQLSDGVLTLRFAPGTAAGGGGSEQALAVRAKVMWYPLWIHQPLILGTVFFALLAGGLSSLLLNQWFPNRIRRVDLEERLGEIATRTRNLSPRVDSGLRILVRVERYRLLRLLDSRYTFSPEMADVLTAAGQAVARLEQKVAILERFDTVASDVRRLRLAIPPMTADGVHAHLRKAGDRLKSPQPSDAELQEAGALVDAAAASLAATGQTDPELVTALTERFERLRKELDVAAPARADRKGQSLTRRLGGLFQYVDSAFPGAALRPDQYFEHDARLARLDLVLGYLTLFAHQPDEVRARLEKTEGDLVTLIGASSWDKTLDARRLLQEMRDDIYTDEVEEEIRGRRLRIIAQPVDPRPHQAVELSAVFTRDAYNVCGAREEYTCEWTFHHEDSSGRVTTWREDGWKVHHFFPAPKTYPVKVCFRRQDGSVVADRTETVTVTGDVTVGSDTTSMFGNRTKIEAMRFGIVLVATIVGLIGGARDQLMKLDVVAGLIAVFLVGFGADAVKNILVDRSAAPAAKK